MPKSKLRIGFDLDGVLLYNPARIARPIVTAAKQRLLRAKGMKFFIPQTPLQRFIWRIFHYSSLFVNPGVNKIRELVQQEKIEAYVISGRYAFLEKDFEKWLKKIGSGSIFKNAMLNDKNQQPHIFKQQAIKNLDLDVFVEDNWDIVQKLTGTKTKILWLYNILDRKLSYEDKFPTLSKALDYIEKKLL